MREPLLSIKNLTVAFASAGKTATAVENVSITVNRGELVAIVGESGSGKSVTSLSVLKLLPVPPASYPSGSIVFVSNKGETFNLLTASDEVLKSTRGNQVSMIFQEPMSSLNPVYTCGNQVMEAIKLHQEINDAEAKKRTIALFEKVHLPDPSLLFNRYPHQLSGGQKQRVMIAMAISCHPALLICDEPTTALDVTVQKNILQLIKQLQLDQNMGVIFITHDLNVVAEIADQVVVMYKGKIVEQAPIEDIFLRPQHPYTKALLACRPGLHSKNERLPLVSDFMITDADGIITELPAAGRFSSTPNSLNLLTDQNDITPADASATKDQKKLIQVQDLQVWFPLRKTFLGTPTVFTRAVDHVSFDVYEGETLGLVGESGCGKSTLGRALLHLITPTGGQVLFNGSNIYSLQKDELRSLRKNMQIIFQDPYSSLNPRLTIGAAISEPLKVHGIGSTAASRKESVIELLEKVSLKPEHYHRYPHEFSGGQRQRIVIARALALKPAFVVCDESVSALDVSVQAQILNLLNDLKKDFGFTAIFISHDLSVVRYISDRIMVMNKGQIVETGAADRVYLHPQSAYTQNLIASIPKGLYA